MGKCDKQKIFYFFLKDFSFGFKYEKKNPLTQISLAMY